MDFLTTYQTSTGINKDTNQDGLLMKTAQTTKGKVGLFIVCDGMGGLSQGELASATVIRGMSDWFEHVLPKIVRSDNFEKEVQLNLEEHIKQLNSKIIAYGESAYVKLGTTITALLIVDSTYYIVQIGDSRAYSITNHLQQLTKDQSLVAREVDRGNLTEQQAINHPKRHVLLQCVGANQEIDVVITTGAIEQGASYMLCTDGFYHKISQAEMLHTLKPETFTTEQQMKAKVVELVELVKRRDEVDDISVIVTKVI